MAFGWAPRWMVAIGVLVGSAIIALIIYNWVLRIFVRMAGRFGTFPKTLVDSARGPVAAILVLAVLGASLPAAGLSYPMTAALAHVLVIAFVLSVGWGAFNALDLGAVVYLRQLRRHRRGQPAGAQAHDPGEHPEARGTDRDHRDHGQRRADDDPARCGSTASACSPPPARRA